MSLLHIHRKCTYNVYTIHNIHVQQNTIHNTQYTIHNDFVVQDIFIKMLDSSFVERTRAVTGYLRRPQNLVRTMKSKCPNLCIHVGFQCNGYWPGL